MDIAYNYIKDKFNVDEKVLNFCKKSEESIKNVFQIIDKNVEINQYKVLQAMQKK